MCRFAIIPIVVVVLFPSSHCAADTFGSGDRQFDIEFVMIGDPGNPPDRTGNPNPAGSVDYEYRIGKHEISREMVEKASADGGLNLTLDPMEFVTTGPRSEMPATGMSWLAAARFVNWLNTSEGFQPAYKFRTTPDDVVITPQISPGTGGFSLWEPTDTGYVAENLFRNSLARYFLPNLDEWYKAAYYDPTKNDGTGGYWDYPTGSDTQPVSVLSGTDVGTAVWGHESPVGPADIELAGGLSPYGVMGQGGNAFEWLETEFDLLNDEIGGVRVLRGSTWGGEDPAIRLSSSYFRDEHYFPGSRGAMWGFRVASVPEPSFLTLGTLGLLALLAEGRRSRHFSSRRLSHL